LAVFIGNECGLTNKGSDKLVMIYTLLTSSCLNMLVDGQEYPGLYMTGALLTQSCIQNTRCVFKGRDNKLFLYAATDIKKGEKLTHSHLKNLVHTGTVERRRLLRELFIDCCCPRCSDQSEAGTHVSDVLCQRCDGTCLPLNTLDQDSPWVCGGCGAGVSGEFVNTLTLSIQEEDIEESEELNRYEAFKEKNKQILPDSHYLITSEKSKCFLQLDSFDTVAMLKKIEAGKDILKLADILEPGLSVHRESILIHLGTCIQILIGDQMMKIYANDDSEEILSDEYILESIHYAKHLFEMALKSSMLEEALDGSKKTSSGKIRESLKMLCEMKIDLEKLMTHT